MTRNEPSTWLGRVLAELYSSADKAEKQGWHDAVDASIKQVPFVGGALADAFGVIIDWVYDPKIERDWNNGVAAGDKTWNECLAGFQDSVRQAKEYTQQAKSALENVIEKIEERLSALEGKKKWPFTWMNP